MGVHAVGARRHFHQRSGNQVIEFRALHQQRRAFHAPDPRHAEQRHVPDRAVRFGLRTLVIPLEVVERNRLREQRLAQGFQRRLAAAHQAVEVLHHAGLRKHHAHRGRQQALRRHGTHQHGAGRLMIFEILLHHEAAHRMPDQHRRRRQGGDRGRHILHVVGDRKAVEMLAARRSAVSGKAQGIGGVTGLGEEGQEMLLPAPGSRIGAMDEKQRRRERCARRFADQDFVMLESGHIHCGNL